MTATGAAPLVLDGRPITVAEVAAVAAGRPARLDAACAERLADTRRRLLGAAAGGVPVYGLSTGLGALKRLTVEPQGQVGFDHLMISSHRVGFGPAAPAAVVRATILARAQGLVQGAAGVRPELVEALLGVLDDDEPPVVPVIGSVGQADLAPLARIAQTLIDRGVVLGPREGLALVGASSFAIGWGALAVVRAGAALRLLHGAAALTFEGLRGNVGALDPAVGVARDLPGVTPVLAELRRLLQGGALLEGREPPAALQDPLSLRVVPQVHAVAATALDAATAVLEAELAAGSDNPLLTEDDRLLTNGNFDGTAVAVALDHLRLALAHVGTLATERTQKLLTPSHSGLAANLRERDDRVEDGLGMYGHGAAALAAEIRLLASPVSLELPTSSLAEGIEDRVVPAPLAARRLDEQAGLLARLAAVELTCAAQAVELRGRAGALGEGMSALVRVVREHAPFTAAGTAPPVDLEPLVAALAGWTLDGA